MEFVTPIIKTNTTINNNNIYVKREDLIPFSFGGNKVRIAQEYFLDMVAKDKNCIIGYGNARSNLCRILANMSKALNVECHIISPSDDNGERKETNNSRIVKSCGAILHMCTKSNVAETVESVINQCVTRGLSPYYIYGDKYGNGGEEVPVRAYEKVYSEIKFQEKELGVKFDYIFLATGTGMTQSGLIVGKMQFDGLEEIIGVSVARESDKEKLVIDKYIKAYCDDMKLEKIKNANIIVLDDYLCGGYGMFDIRIIDTIKQVLLLSGMPLDTTYTGKAFYGMQEYIKKNKIENKNILFLHTGGTPLFFDNIGEVE